MSTKQGSGWPQWQSSATHTVQGAPYFSGEQWIIRGPAAQERWWLPHLRAALALVLTALVVAWGIRYLGLPRGKTAGTLLLITAALLVVVAWTQLLEARWQQRLRHAAGGLAEPRLSYSGAGPKPGTTLPVTYWRASYVPLTQPVTLQARVACIERLGDQDNVLWEEELPPQIISAGRSQLEAEWFLDLPPGLPVSLDTDGRTVAWILEVLPVNASGPNLAQLSAFRLPVGGNTFQPRRNFSVLGRNIGLITAVLASVMLFFGFFATVMTPPPEPREGNYIYIVDTNCPTRVRYETALGPQDAQVTGDSWEMEAEQVLHAHLQATATCPDAQLHLQIESDAEVVAEAQAEGPNATATAEYTKPAR